MSLDDKAFEHVPHLRGRIRDPLTSRYRHLDYEALDRHAAAQGQPPDWRRTDEEREQTRVDALRGHQGGDVWVFAYGSLMWDPGFLFDEVRVARLAGYQRCFCLLSEMGRGSREAPGLMAALDHGGTCEGLAFRIGSDRVEHETRIIWRREMISQGYVPTFFHLDTAQGVIEGLGFVINHDNPRYMRELDPNEAAQMIATGAGHLGTNIEYLDSLDEQLTLLGIHDDAFHALHRKARALMEGEGQGSSAFDGSKS